MVKLEKFVKDLGSFIKVVVPSMLIAVGAASNVSAEDIQSYLNHPQLRIKNIDATTALTNFFDSLPEFTNERTNFEIQHSINEQGRMMFEVIIPSERLEAENQILENFKQFITEFFRTDPGIQKMGFCERCIEHAMQRITQLRISYNDRSDNRGSYSFDDGSMSLNSKFGIEEMSATLLHEVAHIFGWGEDAANLFAEVTLGIEARRPRSDWSYGSHQLRGIYEQAKLHGDQERFWQSMSSEDGVRTMWERYSPKYEREDAMVNLMSFDEWQTLRGIGDFIRGFEDDQERNWVAEKYKTETGRNLFDVMTGLSYDFENTYHTSNMPIQNLREQITELVEFMPNNRMMATYHDYLLQSPLNEQIGRLNALGVSNQDIMEELGEGIKAMCFAEQMRQMFYGQTNVQEQERGQE